MIQKIKNPFRKGGTLPKIGEMVATRPNAVLGIFLFVFLVVFIRTAWLQEGAMEVVRSVLNFIHGYGPKFNINERVQVFTSTGWFFLISLLTWVIGNPYWAMIVTSLGLNLATLFAVGRKYRNYILFFVLLLFSKAYIDVANSGFAYPLSFALLAALMITTAKEKPNYAVSGLLCAGLILSRPELGIFVLCFAAFKIRKHNFIPFAVGLIPFFLWEVFSLFYYGSLVPNPALAKLYTGIPQWELVKQGLRYVHHTAFNDPISFWTIPGFFLVSVLTRKYLWVAASVSLFGLYVVWIGGDGMEGRFLALPFFASALGITMILHELPDKKLQSLLWGGEVFGLKRFRYAVLLLIPIIGFQSIYPNIIAGRAYSVDWGVEKRIWDVRGGLFAMGFSLRDNLRNRGKGWPERGWAKIPKWRADLAEYPTTVLVMCGWSGSSGILVGPSVHILHFCGLLDPLLARLPMKYEGHGQGERKWSPGQFFRHIPPGYEEIVSGEGTQIIEPLAAALYEDVAAVTQGPLWSIDRLRRIVKLNIHDYGVEQHYIHGDFPLKETWYGCLIQSYVGENGTACTKVAAGNNEEGYLTFGPYHRLKAGKYSFEIKYSSSSHEYRTLGKWDVAVSIPHAPQIILAEGKLRGTNGEATKISGTFTWDEKYDGEWLEIRNYVYRNVDIAVSRIRIERLQ